MKLTFILCIVFIISVPSLPAADAPGKSDALVAALKKATQSPDPHVRAAAARGLGEFGDKSANRELFALLSDKDGFVSSAAAEALAKLGDQSTVQELIYVLKVETEKMSSTNSGPVFAGLSNAIPELAWMRSEEASVTTIQALSRMPGTNAVSPILDLGLQSPRIGIRIAAAIALGRLKAKAAVKPLVQILEEHYQVTPKETGLVIQTSEPDRNLQKTKESNAYLRSAIVWALGEIRDGDAKATLTRALEDDNSLVRDNAKEALDKL